MADIFPEEELYEDIDEEAAEGEGSNRTFMILVGGLGGLLLLAICVFVVYIFVVSPSARQSAEAVNHSTEKTNEAVIAAATGTAEAMMATDTPEPTDTVAPSPTPKEEPTATPVPPTKTPRPRPTDTPESEETMMEATPAEVAEAATTPTRETARTPFPTPTPRGGVSKEKELSETGLGTWIAGLAGAGLLLLLAMVRRLRRAV